jgi:hypothetical protein
VLVVVSGLFVRTFTALTNVELGFDKNGVMLVHVNAQRANIAIPDRLRVWAQTVRTDADGVR